MNDPRHQLTPEVQELICNFVRAGGFPHVAAVAAGIPVKVFNNWMRWGAAKRPVPLYRDFREAVEQAQAIARLAAETQALRRAPLSWLRFGPGRETGRLPGWTDAVKPARQEKRIGMSVQRMRELIPVMLEALQDFPEARAALAASLEKLQWLKDDCPEAPSAEAEEKPAVVTPPAQPVEVVAAVSPPTVALPAEGDLRSAEGHGPETVPQPGETVPQPEGAEPAPPAEEKQREPVAEASSKPQESDNPSATAPQRNDNDVTAKTQPTSGETAANPPPAEVQKASPPPRRQRSIWERFNDYPWTVVWRSGD